jgi:hypothetical protein
LHCGREAQCHGGRQGQRFVATTDATRLLHGSSSKHAQGWAVLTRRSLRASDLRVQKSIRSKNYVSAKRRALFSDTALGTVRSRAVRHPENSSERISLIRNAARARSVVEDAKGMIESA